MIILWNLHSGTKLSGWLRHCWLAIIELSIFFSNCNPAIDLHQMRSPLIEVLSSLQSLSTFLDCKKSLISSLNLSQFTRIYTQKVQFYLQYNTIIYQVQNLPNRFYKPSKLTGITIMNYHVNVTWTSRILHGCFALLFAFYILLSPQTLLYWNKCFLHKTINYVIFFFNFLMPFQLCTGKKNQQHCAYQWIT